MSLKKVHDNQPKEFKFSDENLKKAEEILKRYPQKSKKSAVMPFLYLAQRQNDNWIPLSAMKYIANYLSMPYISVYEVATFYTMYNLAPVGKHFVQVCTTTPCLIRGADKIVKLCKEKISPNENEISKKGNCSWMEVECLGACVSAPMIQINDDYYEDLDEKSTVEILDSLIKDKPLKPGSFRGRKNTAPEKKTINYWRKSCLNQKIKYLKIFIMIMDGKLKMQLKEMIGEIQKISFQKEENGLSMK